MQRIVDLLATGAVASTSGIFIQQATTERAGAMRAQQVVDLNAARRDVTDLQKQLAAHETLIAEMQEALGLGDGSTLTNVINNSQISCQVVDGKLHILGATKLIAAGYVPYLFRLTRKRNQYHYKPQYRTESDATRRYCLPTKGWHLYGSCHAVKMDGNILTFSTSGRGFLHLPATAYSPLPQTLVSNHTRKDGMLSFGWGRSIVILNDGQNTDKTKHRLIRLRFTVGFAKKMLPGRVQITPANLVSSMAEFSLIYDPTTKIWHFGKLGHIKR